MKSGQYRGPEVVLAVDVGGATVKGSVFVDGVEKTSEHAVPTFEESSGALSTRSSRRYQHLRGPLVRWATNRPPLEQADPDSWTQARVWPTLRGGNAPKAAAGPSGGQPLVHPETLRAEDPCTGLTTPFRSQRLVSAWIEFGGFPVDAYLRLPMQRAPDPRFRRPRALFSRAAGA